MNQDVSRLSVEIGGTAISFETGKLAKQASGAVVVTQGETMVLATATAGNVRDVDFLPLTVDVEERMYAAGKIPGSFFKREGRAGEKGTLTARMIDRPIRPLFPKGWDRQTQLVAIPMSIDEDLLAQIKERFGDALNTATQVEDKLERQDATGRVEEEVLEAFGGEEEPEKRAAAQLAFDRLEKEVIRQRIAVDKKRPDGRAAEEIRPISIEVGIAPRTHGSALFTRGQTQALSVVALGTTREEMPLEPPRPHTQKLH